MDVPRYDELFNPVLDALARLGGSASIQEMTEEVITILQLPSQMADQPHGDGSQTELEYRLAWARTYLRKYGSITNSDRGVWALTASGHQQPQVDPVAVKRTVRQGDSIDPDPESVVLQSEAWKGKLLGVLQQMPADAFERLCQRVLRESGFVEVNVTGRPGDGGIDGHGVVRLAGILSFPVIFQAKRYKGTVGPGDVRNFRGAMVGRADRGLLLTTGTFTTGAQSEATRDGAPPIDLVNGEQLCEILKQFSLGVETKMVESVHVLPSWFAEI